MRTFSKTWAAGRAAITVLIAATMTGTTGPATAAGQPESSRPTTGETRGSHGTSAMACGVERQNVKTLGDPAVDQIDFGKRTTATVVQLRALKPGPWSNDGPRTPAESVVYEVQAQIIGAKLEEDQDLHIVIADPNDPSLTMVVEIPKPECMDANAPQAQKDQIAAARKLFLTKMKVTSSFKKFKQPLPAVVSGVLFFDLWRPGHEPTGSAPGGIELHPVLELKF